MVKKYFLIFLGVFILFSCVMGSYFLKTNLDLKRQLEQKGEELELQLVVEKDKIKRDLDEKYRADMVSFQAMQKRVELQKKKLKEIETRLKNR
ncbi:MAG: hypothetical protein DRP85_04280 [Candidatus Makaraimicrobium thalassicum]|nr:MAG: hypothetical protein DRP85_04280 [Candidatus Omnitrophota bacterium]